MSYATLKQIEYRAYLASPVWKAKRAEALAFYGCTCNRCREWGNDVHHKTYERVGGAELMEDFEILCRDCHEAHHRATAAKSRKFKSKGVHRRAIFKSLSRKMRDKLCDKFSIQPSQLFGVINYGDDNQVRIEAIKMLGCDHFFGRKPRMVNKRTNKNRLRWGNSYQERMNQLRLNTSQFKPMQSSYYHIVAFKE